MRNHPILQNMLKTTPAEVSKKEERSHDFKDNFDVEGNKQKGM